MQQSEGGEGRSRSQARERGKEEDEQVQHEHVMSSKLIQPPGPPPLSFPVNTQLISVVLILDTRTFFKTLLHGVKVIITYMSPNAMLGAIQMWHRFAQSWIPRYYTSQEKERQGRRGR